MYGLSIWCVQNGSFMAKPLNGVLGCNAHAGVWSEVSSHPTRITDSQETCFFFLPSLPNVDVEFITDQ